MFAKESQVISLEELVEQAEKVRSAVENGAFNSPYEIFNEIRVIFDNLDELILEKNAVATNLDCAQITVRKDANGWSWVADWLLSLRQSSPVARKNRLRSSVSCFTLRSIMKKFIPKDQKRVFKSYKSLDFYIDSIKRLVCKHFFQFDLLLVDFEERVGYLLAFLELYKTGFLNFTQKLNFVYYKQNGH